MVEPAYTWVGRLSTGMSEEGGEILVQTYECSIDGCLVADPSRTLHTSWHNPEEPEA